MDYQPKIESKANSKNYHKIKEYLKNYNHHLKTNEYRYKLDLCRKNRTLDKIGHLIRYYSDNDRKCQILGPLPLVWISEDNYIYRMLGNAPIGYLNTKEYAFNRGKPCAYTPLWRPKKNINKEKSPIIWLCLLLSTKKYREVFNRKTSDQIHDLYKSWCTGNNKTIFNKNHFIKMINELSKDHKILVNNRITHRIKDVVTKKVKIIKIHIIKAIDVDICRNIFKNIYGSEEIETKVK